MNLPKTNLLEPELEQLEAEILTLCGHINAAEYRFLKLLADYDRASGWGRHGLASCVQWLNWQCGIGTVAARERVRTARALETLPLISKAFGRGELSYSKVRALTRVATPENESTLVTIALHATATHVEKLVCKYHRVRRQHDAERAEIQHRERYLDTYWDDGALVVHARLPGEVGALVRQAIEAAMAVADDAEDPDQVANQTQSNVSAEASASADEKVDRSIAARRADALAHVAGQFLAAESVDAGSTGDRYQIVVHIDHSLLSGACATSGCCEHENGRALAIDTARRLGCHGTLVGLVENGNGEPLNVGRKTRAIPAAIRRALRARDGGCRFPGCMRTRFTEGHHIKHWANGGETRLGNLITLCSFHHRLVHEGGFGLRVTDDGIFVFSKPDGSRLAQAGRLDRHLERLDDHPPAALSLMALNHELDLDIDEHTAGSRWSGESMDYGWTTEALGNDDNLSRR
jgi:hypothetical protein